MSETKEQVDALRVLAEKRLKEAGKDLIDPMQFERESPYAEKKEIKRPMVFDAPIKSVEDKKYIVLVIGLIDGDLPFDGHYKICNGRTECYRYIESILESYGDAIDIVRSKIITETKQTETETGDTKYYLMPMDEIISIYSFCKSVEHYYEDRAFDIDQYLTENPEDVIREEKEEDKYSMKPLVEDIFSKMVNNMDGNFINPNNYKKENKINILDLSQDDSVNV